jgi:hypothetical protein
MRPLLNGGTLGGRRFLLAFSQQPLMDDQALLVTTYELAGAPASVIQRIFRT